MNGAVPTRVPATSFGQAPPPSQAGSQCAALRRSLVDSSQPSKSAPLSPSELRRKRRRPSSSVEVTPLESMPIAERRGHSKRDVCGVELSAGAVDGVEPELRVLDRDFDEMQCVHAERGE